MCSSRHGVRTARRAGPREARAVCSRRSSRPAAAASPKVTAMDSPIMAPPSPRLDAAMAILADGKSRSADKILSLSKDDG